MAHEDHTQDRYPPIPDDPMMGAAMRKLTPQQRAFVVAYIERADENASAAARASGYGADSEPGPAQSQAYRTAGYRLIHDARVLEAIKELAEQRFRVAGYRATATLMEIMNTPGHKDQFKAAERVLAQVGMGVVTKVEHDHKHGLAGDEKAMIARITQLATLNGLDPVRLLGSAGVALPAPETIDAEFTVLPAPDMSDAGLEDLL